VKALSIFSLKVAVTVKVPPASASEISVSLTPMETVGFFVSTSNLSASEIFLRSAPHLLQYFDSPGYNQESKIQDYTFYTKGPSLKVTVLNPTWFGLGDSAVVSGDIKIYHTGKQKTLIETPILYKVEGSRRVRHQKLVWLPLTTILKPSFI
jgi:hypothetical protein